MDDSWDGIDGAPTPYEHFHFGNLSADFPAEFRISISKGLDPSGVLIAPKEWTYGDLRDLSDAIREGDEEALKILKQLLERL